MNDEYDELYNMLSSDKEDVRKIKDNFKDDISYYLTKIKNYQANTIDISGNYDLEKEYDKFKMDDIALRYNLNDECLNYKLVLLSKYMEELKNLKQEFKKVFNFEHSFICNKHLNQRRY